MHVKVLKAFDYGHDGVHLKRLEAGETHPVHDHLVEGLAAAGYVEKAKPSKASAKAEDDAKAKAEVEAEAK